MKITFIQPSMGRRAGQPYLRTWQMEPLSLAVLAALTPGDVTVRLVDDRLETIDFEEPTDLVAMTVETYTARRSYQIASGYRRRGVPVVMGGFHPTLMTEEVSRYADSVFVGEAEGLWPLVVDDYRRGSARAVYRGEDPAGVTAAIPDRSIFRGKRYLPVGLVEAGRGCLYNCDFCSIAGCYQGSLKRFPVDGVASQMWELFESRPLVFLVDDSFGGDLEKAKDLCRLLARRPVRWVTQCGIEALHDEELVDLMARSGCYGILIGFESLEASNLKSMNKRFNSIDRYRDVLGNLAKAGVRVYGTFVFGYDGDRAESFDEAVAFAREHAFYFAAFNHLMPFPGTAIYSRLAAEGRLLKENWWLDPDYNFNSIAFRPAGMSPEELRSRCMEARRTFYSLPSIAKRFFGRANRGGPFDLFYYGLMNWQQHREVDQRDGHPLGDQSWEGGLLPVQRDPA